MADVSVVGAVPVSAEVLEVEFSADMEDNEHLRDPEMYAVSGGLQVRHVEQTSARKVHLYVAPPMAKDQPYSIAVVPDPWEGTLGDGFYGESVFGE